MSQELLPLGSVVYLQEGTEKLMIIGRGIVYQDEETNTEVFVDYMGCIFPTGINPNNTIFFNQENIDRVVFEGLKDEDEERFLQVYDEWLKKIDVPKKEIK
ncbi:DUF4176 domain-containing protein [Streptococcus gallolyticus]|uniref:DUF4176 domain-containing protein n=1 Tax=Streptococcus gallolyticus TaxID=315405 RepID=UPI0001E0F2F4|nr:DUF4176 domain-containing protein [Streptococcus gallolyticus]EFM30174.1 hypothetical protein HMPREF9352_0501 [Streptococcus gallolyticus subsp. gallolyticus TX20005]QKI01228.1 DUF4176 domain-containing protein [Streptococcus gallolyticus]QWX87299.1 DUF4176 domain-containing protein [Streptococcus gallolyticus subsp. gallolyticus TX20005]